MKPRITFSTNIIGTLNILEAIKASNSIRSAVIVTSDKCYKNYERKTGYSETSEIGGNDPYSASKAAAENLINSYLKSFFNKKGRLGVSSVRAGNVIGGGDWSKDRIIPDLMKSIMSNKKFFIRNPNATRPWQHVFDLLNGYLVLSKKIYGKNNLNGSWNFGPNKKHITVKYVTTNILEIMNIKKKIYIKKNKKIKETSLLSLKTEKSKRLLSWKPKLNYYDNFKLTANWYLCFIKNRKKIQEFSKKQIEEFFFDKGR